MLVEGCYIYQCESCYLKFALVARLSHPDDYFEHATCPICNTASPAVGEGALDQERYRKQTENQGFPQVLTVKEVMDILKISQGKAYEIMNSKEFPLIRIGRERRVFRNDFMRWLINKGATF